MFNTDKFTKILLVIIALLLTLNLFKSFIHFPSVQAQEGNADIGRYEITVWSVPGNSDGFNRNGYYGYYLLDTKTGRIVDERVNNL